MAFPRNFCILVLQCATPCSLAVQLNSAQAVPAGERQTIIQLGYKQMPFVGSEFLARLVSRMAPDRSTIIGESSGLTVAQRRSVFVIASTRNPCGYYLNMWVKQHHTILAHQLDHVRNVFDFDDETHSNVTKFRGWLAWVKQSQLPVMYAHFWESIVATEELSSEVVNSDLMSLDPYDAADCWVRTETLIDDLRNCLQLYEHRSGYALNWHPFDNVVETGYKTSGHLSCEQYYTPELEQSVMNANEVMFNTFGYTSCCGEPTQPVGHARMSNATEILSWRTEEPAKASISDVQKIPLKVSRDLVKPTPPMSDAIRGAAEMHGDIFQTQQLDSSHTAKIEELSENATVKPMMLGYKHMSKCGGVFVNSIIREMATERHRFFGEEYAVTPERKQNIFMIASVRNPCDYYVSLWAYQHRKPFAPAQNEQFGFFDFDGHHSHTNATKFRSWLSWVQGPRFSVMSTRFWETLIAERDGLSCWKDSMGTCAKDLDDDAVDRDFREKGFKDSVDCWVYVETFTRDLRYCLHKYEVLAGVKLDWKPFNAMDEMKHNPSDHGVCEEYYTPEAEASVMSTDRRLFEAFGYTSCCGPATHPLK